MARARFATRNRIPSIIASLTPEPYTLKVEAAEQRDFGYFAELRRGSDTLKLIELYPYTVVGPGAHRHPDERRIELELKRREKQIARTPPPDRTGVMLGLRDRDVDGSDAPGLLVALSFGIFKDVVSRSSIQFPKRLLLEAEVLGAAAFAKTVAALGTPTRAITLVMRPEIFPFFLTQLADDFAAPQDWDPQAVAQVVEATRRYYAVPDELRRDAVAPEPSATGTQVELRARATREITQPLRDRRFSLQVKVAYDHRCAACDIQLELVQAAHIDPVEDPASTDETQNGIALCALHHLAYDTGLIDILATGAIVVNEQRAAELADSLRAGGLDHFRVNLRSILRPPAKEEDRPATHHFERRTAYLVHRDVT
ncbi:hypothetical protein EPN42_10135 [bacterium]|nr:MAG: hypothetical protein EPN42_10135 [bacterium]